MEITRMSSYQGHREDTHTHTLATVTVLHLPFSWDLLETLEKPLIKIYTGHSDLGAGGFL